MAHNFGFVDLQDNFLHFYSKYCEEKEIAEGTILAKQLSSKWKNDKYSARQRASKFKAATRKTGGGPAPPPLDDATVKINDICSNDGELPCPFDSESSQARKSDILREAMSLNGFDVNSNE